MAEVAKIAETQADLLALMAAMLTRDRAGIAAIAAEADAGRLIDAAIWLLAGEIESHGGDPLAWVRRMQAGWLAHEASG